MAQYEYDAVVIGAGAAGLTAAGMAANVGAKTMLIEKNKLGGDCTWTGCVPSKILLKAAKVTWQTRNASRYGLKDQDTAINFKKLVEHLRSTRQHIYNEADAPERFEAMGINVKEGAARFVDDHAIRIERRDKASEKITSRYFFVCTGASPAIPSIKGIEKCNVLTSESLFEINQLPSKLVILGAGPLGTEMAQALNRLGSEVTVVDKRNCIMRNDDSELSQKLKSSLEKEGVTYRLGEQISRLETANDVIYVHLKDDDQRAVQASNILVAAGRKANVQNLHLELAGVRYSSSGIKIDEKCQTAQSHIYACGDVTGQYQFTHMAEHQAKVAVTRALLKISKQIDEEHVTWCTYTDPELAHLGATPDKLDEKDISYETYRFPYKKLDRAITDAETKGLIKIYAKPWSGKMLGADILGARAGELISEYAVAMKNGVSLRKIADIIHPYPSFGLGARRAADQWYLKNRSPWQVKLIKKIFGYRGDVPEMEDQENIL